MITELKFKIDVSDLVISYLNMNLGSINSKGLLEISKRELEEQKHNHSFKKFYELINELISIDSDEIGVIVTHYQIRDNHDGDIESELASARASAKKKGREFGGMGHIAEEEHLPSYTRGKYINMGARSKPDILATMLTDFQEIVRVFVEDIFVSKGFEYYFEFKMQSVALIAKYEYKERTSSYNINLIEELIVLCLNSVWERKININKCGNCGDYFLPSKRSDEVYCDKVNENNKTCKEMGYQKILESDEGEKQYRREYKRRHAIASKSESPEQKELWEKWKKESREKKDLYKKGVITLDDFLKWINKERK